MCVHITTISFFGHRDIEDMILADRCVYTFVCDMMETHEYLEFLVGRDGLFDQIVSSAIIRAKKQKQAENCNHIWVCHMTNPSIGRIKEISSTTMIQSKSAKPRAERFQRRLYKFATELW